MKNQLHAYANEELYGHCSILADELGLSNSSYLKMLVSKAWNERRGGGFIKSGDLDLKASVLKASMSAGVFVGDRKHGEASKASMSAAVRDPEIGKSRQRHKSKIRKE